MDLTRGRRDHRSDDRPWSWLGARVDRSARKPHPRSPSLPPHGATTTRHPQCARKRRAAGCAAALLAGRILRGSTSRAHPVQQLHLARVSRRTPAAGLSSRPARVTGMSSRLPWAVRVWDSPDGRVSVCGEPGWGGPDGSCAVRGEAMCDGQVGLGLVGGGGGQAGVVVGWGWLAGWSGGGCGGGSAQVGRATWTLPSVMVMVQWPWCGSMWWRRQSRPGCAGRWGRRRSRSAGGGRRSRPAARRSTTQPLSRAFRARRIAPVTRRSAGRHRAARSSSRARAG